MTERSSISTEKSSSSKPAASGSTAKAARRGNSDTVSADERGRMVAMAAYYRAEHRGFAPGGELADWFAAEAEIEQQLGRE